MSELDQLPELPDDVRAELATEGESLVRVPDGVPERVLARTAKTLAAAGAIGSGSTLIAAMGDVALKSAATAGAYGAAGNPGTAASVGAHAAGGAGLGGAKAALATVVVVALGLGAWGLASRGPAAVDDPAQTVGRAAPPLVEPPPAAAARVAAATEIVAPAPVVSAVAPLAPAGGVPAEATVSAPPHSAPIVRARSTRPTSAPQAVTADELELVARAQRAMTRGQLDAALTALDGHARRFGNASSFAEERESLRVVVLARMGREREARTLGARFERRYPRSAYGAAVRDALRTLSPNP